MTIDATLTELTPSEMAEIDGGVSLLVVLLATALVVGWVAGRCSCGCC